MVSVDGLKSEVLPVGGASDSDHGGCRTTARSTGGMHAALEAPNSMGFAPFSSALGLLGVVTV